MTKSNDWNWEAVDYTFIQTQKCLIWSSSAWIVSREQYFSHIPTSTVVSSAGSGCCLSACQMCVNPSRPPGAPMLLTSWWVCGADLFSPLFFHMLSTAVRRHFFVTALFHPGLMFVCYILCLPSVFECETPRQVHQCGFIFVCVFWLYCL